MKRSVWWVGVLLLAGGERAAAQTLGSPVFMSPNRGYVHSEIAGYLSDPGSGISVAVEGEYRYGRPRFDVGLKAGYFDGASGVTSTFRIGADARAPLVRYSERFPLDASLTLGVGLAFGDNITGGLIPIGVSFGRRVLLEGTKTSFVPFVHPVIAPTFGDFNDTQFGLGLGVAITFTPEFDVRVSGALGDYDGLAVGLAWHR